MPRPLRWDPPTAPFTLDDVAPLGVTQRVLDRAAAAGRIRRVRRGVYVADSSTPADPVAAHLVAARAYQLGHPTAVASHHTSALAWGLDLVDGAHAAGSAPVFIVPSSGPARSGRSSSATVHVRHLPPEDRVLHPSGLVTTRPARTAVDVASEASVPEALVTLDAAARMALRDTVGSGRLRDHYTREASLAGARRPLLEASGRAGTQFTRRHLAEVVGLADPRRESALESLSYGHMILAGLPLPELQVRIRTEAGDIFPDFIWRQGMVIGEADGLAKYRSADDLHTEKRRQEALERLGYMVVRWLWRDIVARPRETMLRISRVLEVRG